MLTCCEPEYACLNRVTWFLSHLRFTILLPTNLRIEFSISKLRGFCGLGSLFEGQQTTFGTIEYNNALYERTKRQSVKCCYLKLSNCQPFESTLNDRIWNLIDFLSYLLIALKYIKSDSRHDLTLDFYHEFKWSGAVCY